MATIKETAQEVSGLVPKVMAGVKGNLMFSEDITTQQVITIMTLSEKGTSKICMLSKRMGVSPPTTTGLVDRLERSGYVSRVRDVQDRRNVFVKLTKKGNKFVEKFKKTIQRRWMKVLAHLTEKERKEYISILKKISSALSEGL